MISQSYHEHTVAILITPAQRQYLRHLSRKYNTTHEEAIDHLFTITGINELLYDAEQEALNNE